MQRVSTIVILLILNISQTFGQKVSVTDTKGEPLGLCHLRVIENPNQLFIADQNGVFYLPEYVSSGEVLVSHIGFETLRATYQKGKEINFTLIEKTYDLGEFVFTPNSEEDIFNTAHKGFNKLMQKTSITKAYYKVRGAKKENEEIFNSDHFGVYLYRELVDRNKKKFAWYQNGLNGFAAEHSRIWYDDQLKAPSKFENFSQLQGVLQIVSRENFGFLNDLFSIVSQLRFKDLQLNKNETDADLLSFLFVKDDIHVEIEIHEFEEKIKTITAKQLPLPNQPKMLWSTNKTIEANFSWDSTNYFLTEVIIEDSSDELMLSARLFLKEQNSEWDTTISKDKASSFFDYSGTSFLDNFNLKHWTRIGLIDHVKNQTNSIIKEYNHESQNAIHNEKTHSYWSLFFTSINEAGIYWGADPNK